MQTITREDLIRKADQQHAEHPQYRGHWDGAEWRVASVVADVRTKAGVPFVTGDVVLAREGDGAIVAYSARTKMDTHVPLDREAIVFHDAEGAMYVGARWNREVGGIEHVEPLGDAVCVKHDLWLDPTEGGCVECYVASRIRRGA